MITVAENKTWIPAGRIQDFPKEGGGCVKYKAHQIAVFNFSSRKEWYATDNLCPHKHQMILSRGMIGDSCNEPKVACPYHKKSFSLKSGENLNGEAYCIKTYPVRVENELIYIDVSSIAEDLNE